MNASSACKAPCILLDEVMEEGLPLNKYDFVHAVETLAGDVRKPADDLEEVYLTCPYDIWKQVFGEPRNIQEHHSVQVWSQPCSDGVVHCVGSIVDDPCDGKVVILMRVCLF
jgi:hypothetical protein